MHNVLRKPIVFIVMFLLVITGCGNNSTAINNNNEGSTPSASPTVKTITHSLGESKIEGTPKRVVVLEWTYAEDLLALGVQPVGVADIAGYQKWVTAEPALADTVVDVGTRQEPNLEVITSLKPDLIIASANRVKDYDSLNNIATTLAFNPYIEPFVSDQYGEMIATFKIIADVLGMNAEGEAVLADLEQTYADAKVKIEEAGKVGEPFVLTQAFSSQNAAALRLFLDNSLAATIMSEIGLVNAYTSEKVEAYGFSTASVESLQAVQDANFFYVVQDDDNVFENQLKDNAIWKSLTFVKEERSYALDSSTWLFGGPISAKVFANQVADILAK